MGSSTVSGRVSSSYIRFQLWIRRVADLYCCVQSVECLFSHTRRIFLSFLPGQPQKIWKSRQQYSLRHQDLGEIDWLCWYDEGFSTRAQPLFPCPVYLPSHSHYLLSLWSGWCRLLKYRKLLELVHSLCSVQGHQQHLRDQTTWFQKTASLACHSFPLEHAIYSSRWKIREVAWKNQRNWQQKNNSHNNSRLHTCRPGLQVSVYTGYST